MSGKRIKSQLTREEAYLDRDESRDEDVFEPPKQASQETMARRKIAAYKPKFGGGVKSSTAAPASNGTAPSTGGSFSFLNKSTASTTITPSVSGTTNETPKKNPFAMFSQPTGVSATSTTPSTTTSVIDKALQIKSLNSNFLESIKKSITTNPVADLNPILKKYSEYYGQINQGQIEIKNKSASETSIKPFNSTTTTTTIPSTVSAIPKPVTATTQAPALAIIETSKDADGDIINIDSDSDESDDEVKIEGPQFSVKELPKSRDYGFKFGYAPPPDSDEDSEDEVKIEGPKFQLGGDVKIKDAVFKFSNKEESQKEESKKDTTSGPTFSFGSKTTVTTEEKKETPKFGFTPTADSASSFKFGSSTSSSSVPELPVKPNVANPAPAFQFSAKPTSNFSFGSNTGSNAEKKDTADAPAIKPFTFGTGAPGSTATDKKEESKPTFSFGSTNGFSGFGSSSASTAPASSTFSFGSSNTGTAGDSKPNPFNFGGAAFGSNGSKPASGASSFNFSFTAPTGSTNTPVTSSEPTNTTSVSEKVEENEVKGDFTLHPLTEKVEVKSGEEEEDSKYTKRSKITKTNPETKANEAVGLGDLKLLQNKSSKKSRILVRADASGNVLLNIPIVKDVTYELTGKKKNLLILPEFKTDGTIVRYYAMVKTSEDGQELLKHVQDCQKEMQ